MDVHQQRILGRTGLPVGRLGVTCTYGASTEAFEEAFERGRIISTGDRYGRYSAAGLVKPAAVALHSGAGPSACGKRAYFIFSFGYNGAENRKAGDVRPFGRFFR